ncbi:MAG: hypothetical protein ACTSPD_16275 [Promethearchaeota archaeon]
MSFKLPPFLIKKIFPPKKAVSTIDTTGDGKADSIQIRAINVIQPFTIPESIDLGDFDINDFDLSEYGEILLDGESINLSKENVNFNTFKNVKIFHKDRYYSIEDILSGAAAGKVIALGDSLTIFMKLPDKALEKLTEGKHTITIQVENMPTIEISFELNKNNMNIKKKE